MRALTILALCSVLASVLAEPALGQRFTVGSATAAPGEIGYGAIGVPAGRDSETAIAVAIVNGARPGPVLALVAGSHGTEDASIVAVKRLIARLDPRALSGTVIVVPPPYLKPARLRIATFNLWHGYRLERAIAVVLSEPSLAGADVLALQEADERVAERFATALGMEYVCARGAVHPRTGRGFGPALLSRWPMEDPEQLDLPHRGIHGILRTAVAATVRVDGEPVRAYAVHFGNLREMLPTHQAAQARVVLPTPQPSLDWASWPGTSIGRGWATCFMPPGGGG